MSKTPIKGPPPLPEWMTKREPEFIEDEHGPAQPAPSAWTPATIEELYNNLPISEAPENPKELTGRRKVPMLSVVPTTSIIAEALAMKYGAYDAKRVDGSKGYGPYNWRLAKVEVMTYIDAVFRHCAAWVDGENTDPDSNLNPLYHAKASLGILIDAMECGAFIDNRPPKGPAAAMLERFKQ